MSTIWKVKNTNHRLRMDLQWNRQNRVENDSSSLNWHDSEKKKHIPVFCQRQQSLRLLLRICDHFTYILYLIILQLSWNQNVEIVILSKLAHYSINKTKRTEVTIDWRIELENLEKNISFVWLNLVLQKKTNTIARIQWKKKCISKLMSIGHIGHKSFETRVKS